MLSSVNENDYQLQLAMTHQKMSLALAPVGSAVKIIGIEEKHLFSHELHALGFRLNAVVYLFKRTRAGHCVVKMGATKFALHPKLVSQIQVCLCA